MNAEKRLAVDGETKGGMKRRLGEIGIARGARGITRSRPPTGLAESSASQRVRNIVFQ